MSYLLDVNVLVAWGWRDHADHDRAVRWIAAERAKRGVKLLTSAIPEIGFVRVSVQRSRGQISVAEAAEVLEGMIGSLGACRGFLADDMSGIVWPEWCQSAARTTDAHLLALAESASVRLATLDREIPGAFLLPLREPI